MKKLLRKIQKGSLLVLMLVLIVCAQPVPAKAAATDSMTIYAMYLDAQDKGDAVLIKSAGEYILMDLGYEDHVPALCKQLKAIGVTHFKLYLSHLHIDHVGGRRGNFMAGLNYLREQGFTIDYMYLPDPSLAPESIDYPEKYRLLREYMGGEDRIMYLQQGSQFVVGYATFEVLAPSLAYVNSIHPGNYSSKVPDDDAEMTSGQKVMTTYYENDCSLITRVSCDGVSFLTGGDLLKVEAEYLVKELGSALKADIYQLSHHGTALGSTKNLLEAIDPIYTFAINNGSTAYNYELQQWAFNRSLIAAKPVSMPYYVANEKQTIAYRISNGGITLYQGASLSSLKKVKGWISVYGSDGINRQKDFYYSGENGGPVAGVKSLDGKKYYFSTTGCMDYGDYDEYGMYLGWKEYDTAKHRYFRLVTEDGKTEMLTGFQTIDGNLYYFDSNGWLEEGGDELGMITIGDRTYAVDEEGIFHTNELLEFGGKQYYFGKNGEMAVKEIVSIDGAKYYFGKYGTKQYNLLTQVGTETYYFNEEGKMIANQELTLNNKEYCFDKTGAMICKKIVKRHGNFYYYGKYGTKVKNKIAEVDGASYYFDEEGIMAKDQMVTVGTKTYYFDKHGKMVISQFVTDKEGNKYYFGKYGTMVTSKTVTIEGEKYTFDEKGMIVTTETTQTQG